MDRRAERVYQAKRAGLVSRAETALGPERAEAVVAAWEAEARSRALDQGSRGFWDGAEGWLTAALQGGPRR